MFIFIRVCILLSVLALGAPHFGNSQFEAQTTDAFNQIQITAPITPPSAKRFPSSYPANILPNRNECGLDTISDRIYGGQVAGLDELPWLARIKYLRNSKPIYACHGSLISSRYVVTAGHCVEGLQIIGVRLGEWDTETDVDCVGDDCSDPPEDVEVESSFIYPFYNRKLIIGDIALLRLATPVNFTEFVRPICLPTTEYVARKDYDLDNSYVTGGWGRTEYELRAVVKRKITLNAVPMSICRLAIPRISDALASSSICAGGRKGEDSCAGDSGSSLVKLVSENNQLNWFLYGVTSFGPSKCGAEGLPGIYTRTTYYLDWILRTISANATEIVVKSQV
ncbi:hypothetical protein MSG28_006963 [Choristoneura fumiferana]|uniref:Uncharacterized protein n=1 Tax=Choristoneura fumiferana TaxID=7141 RepID=A0ACC0JLS3_CHOFU|nr:hypothetical protein MSG28_006963 [Choristoneura fumiferana]